MGELTRIPEHRGIPWGIGVTLQIAGIEYEQWFESDTPPEKIAELVRATIEHAPKKVSWS